MGMERYKSIGVAAGAMMLPWAYLNQHLPDIHNTNVSVFINLEGVLRNLTLQKNLNELASSYKKKIVLDLESSIINMLASYRSYFLKERCTPKIYLYYTSLNKSNQRMTSYCKYYRNYYRNKYCQNPEFCKMGKLFQDTIVPEVKLILSYVKDCYLIESKDFDSSLIPLILMDKNVPSVVISTDVFDTLYLFQENFKMIYIKRRYSNLKVISDIEGVIQSIIKGENPFDLSIFSAELYFRLLLSIKGSKIRNIASAKGFGYSKFLNAIKNGVEEDIVLRDFESIDSVIELFPDKYREDIKNAFLCTDLELQYDLLTEVDIEATQRQAIDRLDSESLDKLNNERFLEFPINIPALM